MIASGIPPGPLRRFGLWLLIKIHRLDRFLARWCALLSQRLRPNDHDKAKDGTAAVLALATFAVTQTGALAFVANFTDRKPLLLIVLAVLTVFTVIGNYIVLRLPRWPIERRNKRRLHYYTRGTIALARWSLALAVVFPILIGLLLYLNLIGPKGARQTFPPGEIACEEINEPIDSGAAITLTLWGTEPRSLEAKRGSEAMNRWLAFGAWARVNRDPKAAFGEIDTWLGNVEKSKPDELKAAVDKMRTDFTSNYSAFVSTKVGEGLYAIRQSVAFDANYEEFACTFDVAGASERKQNNEGVDRLAFLVSSEPNEAHKMTIRPVYFKWDSQKGMTNELRVKPDKGERLVVLTYLAEVQKATAKFVAK